ncbi:glycosyl transferase family 2 [Isoptericola jiangsuensis]|uniref:4,4'-diaponeurosporenoate glycosyltransferase n=1 Tax=Isoptericola jiangsuensis TaxID=548579 RepID=A0A2A9F1Y5_9MICO|nr:glycosyltransferase [Isoptericola jiangsuensis]PFG44465.1 glycosyl transferase family 2 [Isoptericola jiangsuensis]
MSDGDLGSVLVVVPVRDEEDLLPACLTALRRAVDRLGDARPDVDVEVVVVLDGCTDGSASIARRSGFRTVTTSGVGVGAARRRGVRAVRTGVPAERAWIACTDADSEVPPGWLTRQVELADSGADVVVGTVRPRLEDLSPERATVWRATHRDGAANGHVHGANLGIRRSVYTAAGGFAAVAEHEDVAIVEAARGLGGCVVADAVAEVLTSARLVGRTPGGYARHLRDDLVTDRTTGTGRRDLAG